MSMFGGCWLHVGLQGPPKIMINLMRMMRRMMMMTMMELIFLNSGFGQFCGLVPPNIMMMMTMMELIFFKFRFWSVLWTCST